MNTEYHPSAIQVHRTTKLSVSYTKFVYFMMTLSVIVTSGSNITVVLFAASSLLALIRINTRKFLLKNLFIAFALSILLIINSMVLNISNTNMHELYVYMIRFVCLVILCSMISAEKFFDMYIKILYFVFCVCLFFWGILFILNNTGHVGLLPASIFDHIMMDSTSRFLRLKAFFWEGGVCSIHANIGITYCICKGLKETKKYAIVFLMAVLCSFSSTGFIVLVLQGILYYMKNRNGRYIPKKVFCLVLFAVVMLVVEEATVGVVLGKLVGHGHSFTSRFDDTVLGLLIAKDHMLSGIGVATDTHTVFLDYYYNNGIYKSFQRYFSPDLASSNGLVNCLYKAGIPFTIVYILAIYRQLKYVYGFRVRESLVILMMYVCYFVGEPIMSVPLMLMFFFRMKVRENGNEIRGPLHE